ncbi:WXG100 family type VII secretion target [Nocardia sp. NBC_00416]|uniref:WXG100 family type VII secretion target n=1 Tax=Nocardia sp. NBC_00416 TaxID=2975991 RepID=UPI002E23C036
MGEQFRADTGELRATAPAFEQLGAEVAALVQRLQDLVSSDIAPWGGDDTGRAFAETFVPEERQTLSELGSLTDVLRQTGPDLRQVADNFERQDLVGGQQIRTADSETPRTRTPAATNFVAPVGGADPYVPADTGAPAVVPRANDPASTRDVTETPASSAHSAGAAPSNAAGSSAPTSGGSAADAPGQAPPQQSPQRQSPYDGTGARNNTSTDRTGSPATPSITPPASGLRPVPNPGSPGSAAAVTRSARGGSPGTAGTPWSSSGRTGPPRVAAPGPGGSDTPPRMPGRTPQRPAEKPGAAERDPAAAAAESFGARLARELAERHGVRAFGFETPGVPREVLIEIVAAVNDVLPRHPAMVLAAIGIDEISDGAPIRLDLEPVDRPAVAEDSAGADTGHVANPGADGNLIAACITLSAGAAVEPAQWEHAIRRDEAAGGFAPGCARRPVYSAVVRELGRVLDAAGGFRARAAARRALIAAYLPLAGPETAGSLARTVAGFGQWRAQLNGGFPAGRFEPAAALAEAFTEVVLDARRASPPARALHRLLVETADPAGTRRDPAADRLP